MATQTGQHWAGAIRHPATLLRLNLSCCSSSGSVTIVSINAVQVGRSSGSSICRRNRRAVANVSATPKRSSPEAVPPLLQRNTTGRRSLTPRKLSPPSLSSSRVISSTVSAKAVRLLWMLFGRINVLAASRPILVLAKLDRCSHTRGHSSRSRVSCHARSLADNFSGAV